MPSAHQSVPYLSPTPKVIPNMRFLLLCCFLSLGSPTLPAQDLDREGVFGEDWGGYLWGLKGGLSLSNQDWSGIETEINLGYHGALFYETIPASGRFSLYGQVGYHQRGSRISRRRGFTFSGNQVTLPADDFVFHNASLQIGAKSVVGYTRIADLYYLLGLRIEYSFANNLGEYDELSDNVSSLFRLNYPFDEPMFINEVVYGASFGAGAIAPLSSNVGAFVELSAHPDFSFQYNQGPIENVIDPFGGPPRTISQRMIRNFTIELSVGLRFLRSYRYVD